MSAVSVVAGIERDLEELETRLAGVSGSGLAAAALKLAERMDSDRTSTTALANAARELKDHMERLVEMVPPRNETDELDELVARRAARPSGQSRPAGLVRPAVGD